jgi:tryptophan synthase beta chain
MKQGTTQLVTETGAGQWGTSLAYAAKMFDLKCRIYMVRASYLQKPGRRLISQLYGAEMFASPSNNTEFGRKLLAENPNHNGSLGIAISEAVEDCMRDEHTRYTLGSVLNHVAMHQTIIGQEAKKQFDMIDTQPRRNRRLCRQEEATMQVSASPSLAVKLKVKRRREFIACESKAVPHNTRGKSTLRLRRHRSKRPK